jgi:hypothetical protein
MEKNVNERANQARVALKYAVDAVIANPKLSYDDIFTIADKIINDANKSLSSAK